MKFKYEKKCSEFWSLDPKLQLILCDLNLYSKNEYGKEIILTELLRKPRNDNDVHAYGRGTDVRSWIYTPEEKKEIVEYINRKYPYGSDKPTILFHDIGQGEHFHVQVRYTRD